MLNHKTILISRTDSIGDVVLTLPVAGSLKKAYPQCRIIFLGTVYTEPVVRLCEHVDTFVDWHKLSALSEAEQIPSLKGLKADVVIHVFPRREIARLAKKAAIPVRVGTSHRLYHWFSCNRLLALTRKNSPLHEAQLNQQLLSPFRIPMPDTNAIKDLYGLHPLSRNHPGLLSLIDKTKFNLILHPKSKGSGREWGLERFLELINILPEDHFNIFITATASEGELMRDWLPTIPERVHNLVGKLGLSDFIALIGMIDGLVAAGTGPLHVAAALGKKAVGLYPPIRPIHPGRWAPLGKDARFLVKPGECEACRKTQDCSCMRWIKAEAVKDALLM